MIGQTYERLNWGCGDKTPAGWLSTDLYAFPGMHLRSDIRYGLPLRDGGQAYVFTSHALQQLPFVEVLPALAELRRVLRDGGVLRLALPDMERALSAYHRGDASYFLIPDSDARTAAGKFSLHLTWYGSTLTPMSSEFAQELLERAGYSDIRPCCFRETAHGFPDLDILDNRPAETFFIEAVK